MNRDCCWCAHEKDLGSYYCRHSEHMDCEEFGDDVCAGCKDYKTREDAKAEWRYKDLLSE